MEILNVGQSRISTHLTLLKEVGLVVDRREGRRAIHSIALGYFRRSAGQCPERSGYIITSSRQLITSSAIDAVLDKAITVSTTSARSLGAIIWS